MPSPSLLMMLVAVGSVVGLVFLWRKPWRVQAREHYLAPLPSAEAQRRIQDVVAARRGWRVVSATPYEVIISTRANWFTWRKRIEVQIRPWTLSETQVWTSSAAPQIYDWRDGRRALAAIRSALVFG